MSLKAKIADVSIKKNKGVKAEPLPPLDLSSLPPVEEPIKVLGKSKKDGMLWVQEGPRIRMTTGGMHLNGRNNSSPEARVELPLPHVLYGINGGSVINVFAFRPRSGLCYPLPLPSLAWYDSVRLRMADSEPLANGKTAMRPQVRALCIRNNYSSHYADLSEAQKAGIAIEEFWDSTFRYYTSDISDPRIRAAYAWVHKIRDPKKMRGLYGSHDPLEGMKRWEKIALSTAKTIPWEDGEINDLNILL